MRRAVHGRSPRDACARLLLVLLLALAPALNLAAPVAPRDSTASVVGMAGMDDTGLAAGTSEPCTHANVSAGHDGAGCGTADHAGDAHHADPLCLQCVAFGVPGLPGAPDVAVEVSSAVAATVYRCHPESKAASRDLAAQGCRGPPHAV